MKVNKIANFINNNKTAQKVLKSIDKNPAIYSAVTAFAFASVLRPSLIGCFKFKDQEDKKYSQASSIAAGVVELGVTAAAFIPLNKSIDKASEALFKSNNPLFKENPANLRKFKSITNRGIKVLALIPISLLRFSIVKPLVDIIYGKKDGSDADLSMVQRLIAQVQLDKKQNKLDKVA